MAQGHYHFSVKGQGRSIVARAAYRSGERLVDYQTGREHDFSHRSDRGEIEATEILAPDGAPRWVHDREQLWNRALEAERRHNGRIGTEFEIGLPHELNAGQRRELAVGFVRDIVDRHRVVADLGFHRAHDERNHHVHVTLSHRELGPGGFGDIANSRYEPHRRAGGMVMEKRSGIAATPQDVKDWRRAWEAHANRALERAGIETRVDSRSYREQHNGREPTVHEGQHATALERKGERTFVGDYNRAVRARNVLRERDPDRDPPDRDPPGGGGGDPRGGGKPPPAEERLAAIDRAHESVHPKEETPMSEIREREDPARTAKPWERDLWAQEIDSTYKGLAQRETALTSRLEQNSIETSRLQLESRRLDTELENRRGGQEHPFGWMKQQQGSSNLHVQMWRDAITTFGNDVAASVRNYLHDHGWRTDPQQLAITERQAWIGERLDTLTAERPGLERDLSEVREARADRLEQLGSRIDGAIRERHEQVREWETARELARERDRDHGYDRER